MAIVGYARVSTMGQNLDVQLGKLVSYGCDKIFKEKASGTTAGRPQLTACMNYLREGDVLVITKLDRLARSTFHLCQIHERLAADGIDFVVIDQKLETATPQGKLLFDMLAAIAEFETAIRAERQREGIDKAREKGVKFGRPSSVDAQAVAAMKQDRREGMKIKALMAKYKLSKASVYRLLDGVTVE